MAIQMRRGAWSQFDPTKMLPGEWAVILSGHPDTSNGQALYHCFAAGTVKQIATIEDAATIIANATEDIRDELTQDISELAVPLMTTDVRGGAKLGTGLRLDDGRLSVEPISVASVHAITGIGA